MSQIIQTIRYIAYSWLTSVSLPGPHNQAKLPAASCSLFFLTSHEGLSDM
jgi:hypothetical protein